VHGGLGHRLAGCRPGNDATGITVVLLLTAATIVAGVARRRPWLWALRVGAWTPLIDIGGPGGAASHAAVGVAGVGAAIGYSLAWAIARTS